MFEPELLDRLCLSGAVSWGRLSPHPRLAQESAGTPGRRIVPTAVAPISVFPREQGAWLLAAFGDEGRTSVSDPLAGLSDVARDLSRALHDGGASFFADLVRSTCHLSSEVEDGLWELVAAGLVTADGFDNLRALMDPRRRRAEGRERARRPRHAAGRWALLRTAINHQPSAPTTQHSAPSTLSPNRSRASCCVDTAWCSATCWGGKRWHCLGAICWCSTVGWSCKAISVGGGL